MGVRNHHSIAALQKAIELVGVVRIARHCGIAPQAVMRWKINKIAPVPADRAPGVEAATGGRVRCEDLRPDVAWHRDADGHPVAYTVRIESVMLRAIA